VSLLVFLLAVWVLTETYALAGLWWAMVVFVVARAISLWVYVPRFWNHFARDDEVTV
jgi:Na+-driven multidrug efflux pump